jgi:serine/threonine protein kinase
LALTPGTRLGVYEVTAPIGEGGMGQVYRATDTTLGRQVAIKILPDAFASDHERMARFAQEAKTLASLNHPNIVGQLRSDLAHHHQHHCSQLVRGRISPCRPERSPGAAALFFVSTAVKMQPPREVTWGCTLPRTCPKGAV